MAALELSAIIDLKSTNVGRFRPLNVPTPASVLNGNYDPPQIIPIETWGCIVIFESTRRDTE
jgi:hypothetical protein